MWSKTKVSVNHKHYEKIINDKVYKKIGHIRLAHTQLSSEGRGVDLEDNFGCDLHCNCLINCDSLCSCEGHTFEGKRKPNYMVISRGNPDR